MVKGRNLASVFVVLALGGVAWAVTVAEATGKGAFIDSGSGVTTSISFKAGVDDTGAFFGELQEKQSGNGLKFHGDILCFEKLNDTTAVFGGVIDSASDPALVGQFFEVEVVDNGEGGGSAPDEYGIDISGREPDCDQVNVRLEELIRGNIQVH